MGVLKAIQGDDLVPIPAQCLIGRSEACALRVERAEVSNEHASLRWLGDAWELRDLGSRNGTFLEGSRLSAGQGVLLRQGASFGLGTAQPSWKLVDAEAPLLAAFELGSRTWVSATGAVLGLPNDDSPLVSITHMPEQGWLCQGLDGTWSVRNGEILTLGSQRWRLHLPSAVSSTVEAGQNAGFEAPAPRLVFSTSKDEEYVELRVISAPSREHRLGARAHNYLLLVLARLRARDASDPALAPSEHGWIHLDELGSMLRLDRAHLYVTIHRARRQFASLGIPQAASVVAARAGTGMVRLGYSDFEITST